MLFDPKWEKLSLANLIAWLEQQSAEKEYIWVIPSFCLIGQWLLASGVEASDVAHKSAIIGGSAPFDIIALSEPFTFGAALERARTVQNARRG